MAMKFHGDVRGEVGVNFLTLVPQDPTFHVMYPQVVPNCSYECSFVVPETSTVWRLHAMRCTIQVLSNFAPSDMSMLPQHVKAWRNRYVLRSLQRCNVLRSLQRCCAASLATVEVVSIGFESKQSLKSL